MSANTKTEFSLFLKIVCESVFKNFLFFFIFLFFKTRAIYLSYNKPSWRTRDRPYRIGCGGRCSWSRTCGGRQARSLRLNGNLGIIDPRKIACPCRLMFLRLKRERVRIDTRVRRTGVVLERLHLVEVLTLLLLEAVLAVEDQLEGIERTDRQRGGVGTFFSPLGRRATRRRAIIQRSTDGFRRNAGVRRGRGVRTRVQFEANLTRGTGLGREVPHLRVRGAGTGQTPDQFLDRVVVGQADLLGGTGGDGVRASVLHLLNEVFVTLLGEAASLLGIEVHT